MGNVVATFDPNANTTGTFSAQLSNGIGKIIVWNESNWILDLTFVDGETDIAPAWTASIFELNGPAGKITWTQDTQLTLTNSPISKCWVVSYRDDESIPGVFPLALVRQASVGNTVTTTGSQTGIVNDGAALTPSNVFIESTPAGAASSTVSIATDGTVTIKGDVAGTLTTLIQTIIAAAAGASSVKLSDAARQTEVLGTLLVDGASTLTGDATFNGLLIINTNNKFLKGKDSAGTIYRIAGYDNVNAKQLNLSDTAVGILADIQSNAKVDGTFEAVGAATLDSTLTVTGTSTLTGAVTATNNSNNIQASTLQGGANLPAGRLGFASDGDIIDANSATGTYIKARTAGTIFFQTPNGTEIGHFDSAGLTLTASHDTIDISATSGNLKMQAGTLTRMTSFSGTGSQTVNTNLGTTPTQITFNPCNISGSSQTIGGTNAQSTVVTTGSGLGWGGVAYKS